MNKLTVISIIMVSGAVSISCQNSKMRSYSEVNQCTTVLDSVGENYIITCLDRTLIVPVNKGQNGQDGSDGKDGVDGQNGQNGADGQDGKDGQDGAAGAAGTSCTVTQLYKQALITCTDGTSAIVNDGSDGSDGTNGQDGIDGADGQDGQNGQDGADGEDSLVEVINPCGDAPGHDELFFRFSDGNVYALYYDHPSKRSFFTVLLPGSYVTTDGTDCKFTVSSAGVISW